jgi:hypothetical protein
VQIILRVNDLETSDNFQAYYNYNKGASRQNSLTDSIVTIAFRLTVSTPASLYYHTVGPILFPDISFSEKPVVVATGDDGGPSWVACRISELSTTSFKLGLLNVGHTSAGPAILSPTVGVHIIAVGPVSRNF